MTSWTLIEALEHLRAEFDHEFPGRDHASDGAKGDTAHAGESSDHNPDETGNTPYKDSDSINEVHAIDVDADLRRPGVTMQDCIDIIVTRHRTGKMAVLQNIIHNRKIWSRSWGWTAQPYTGANPHDKHGHFSGRYGSGTGSSNPENYTGRWGLDEIMTKDELRAVVDDALSDFFARGSQGEANDNTVTSRVGRDALDQGVPNPIRGRKTPAWQLLGDVAAAVKPANPN